MNRNKRYFLGLCCVIAMGVVAIGRLFHVLFAGCLVVSLLPAVARGSYRDCYEATARVSRQTGGGAADIGSGVVFQEDAARFYVLTNAHVVGEQVGVEVGLTFTHDGRPLEPIRGRVDWTQLVPTTSRDLAVVSIAKASIPPDQHPPVIPLAIAVPAGSTATVFSAGCARGGWPTAWVGHIVSRDAGSIEFLPKPATGRSGSAVFNEDGTRIVAIIAWQTTSAGRAIRAEEIWRALEGKPVAHTKRSQAGDLVPASQRPMVPVPPVVDFIKCDRCFAFYQGPHT